VEIPGKTKPLPPKRGSGFFNVNFQSPPKPLSGRVEGLKSGKIEERKG
jgi:hypothetical protein